MYRILKTKYGHFCRGGQCGRYAPPTGHNAHGCFATFENAKKCNEEDLSHLKITVTSLQNRQLSRKSRIYPVLIFDMWILDSPLLGS